MNFRNCIILFLTTAFCLIPHCRPSNCKPRNPPYPAPQDLCVFYYPDALGMVIPRALHNLSLPNSLHGWFPKILSAPLPPIPYETFVTSFRPLHCFVDSTTLTDSVGCGQYREYAKHGAKSGYSYDQWANAVDDCPTPTFPHQCRFNGTHNVIQSLSTYPLGTVGCRSVPFVSNCFF